MEAEAEVEVEVAGETVSVEVGETTAAFPGATRANPVRA